MRVFIVALVLVFLGCWQGEAAFEKQAGQRSLVLGEITSYAGKNFKQEYYQFFYDQLAEELQNSQEFSVSFRENYPLTAEAKEKLAEAHREAILCCGDYDFRKADDRLYFFAQKHKVPVVAKGKLPCLTEQGRAKLQVFEDVELVLFVNITDMEVISSVMNYAPGTKPLTMKFNLDYVYYLVDKQKGTIFRKKLTSNKHSGAAYMMPNSKQFTLQDIAKLALQSAAKDLVQELRGAIKVKEDEQ